MQYLEVAFNVAIYSLIITVLVLLLGFILCFIPVVWGHTTRVWWITIRKGTDKGGQYLSQLFSRKE